MITELQIKERIQHLQKDETTSFSSKELGTFGTVKNVGGIIIGRTPTSGYPNYKIYMCGDACGDHNISEAVSFVLRNSNIK